MPESFLVSPGESALAGDPLVLDVRAAETFAAGHLPGAVHLDLWGFSLIDTDPAPLAAFLWMVEHVLALRGVSDASSAASTWSTIAGWLRWLDQP